MELGQKIGEGKYRECFEIVGTGFCVKKLKNFCDGDMNFVSHFFSRVWDVVKYQSFNLNKKELDIFQNLPPELRSYLPEEVRLEETENGSFLVVSRPRDYDGSFSKTLGENGLVKNDEFWEHLCRLVQLMIENEMFFWGVFQGSNIIIQKISFDHYRPVLVDVKKIGISHYPFQLNLLLKQKQKEKFLRKYRRFKQEFQPGW